MPLRESLGQFAFPADRMTLCIQTYLDIEFPFVINWGIQPQQLRVIDIDVDVDIDIDSV